MESLRGIFEDHKVHCFCCVLLCVQEDEEFDKTKVYIHRVYVGKLRGQLKKAISKATIYCDMFG